MGVDWYQENIIRLGDEGSDLLNKICAQTLKNNKYVDAIEDGMNGLAGLRIPEGFIAVAHTATGDPSILEPEDYASSLVERLFYQATAINGSPLGFSDVIDASKGDNDLVKLIGNSMVEYANSRNLAILNGELAILGDRINCHANMNGTMVSIVPRNYVGDKPFEYQGTKYVPFDPKGRLVYLNSDGEGTKIEIQERAKKPWRGLNDSAVMKADDAKKRFAHGIMMFDVVERNYESHELIENFDSEALIISRKLGFPHILVHEYVGDRIRGWRSGEKAYNISGSMVSLIDEEMLKNPPKPAAGDFLIAIRGRPNPRSNGISEKRRAMVAMLGEEWHTTEEGIYFLEFLAEPSTMFYPLFSELMDNGLASGVTHMSGGAYKGKLAKFLAKYGLKADIYGLYEPDPRELKLAKETTIENAYSKWPMGNEGFVTTKNPKDTLKMIEKYGLEGKVVGRLDKAYNLKILVPGRDEEIFF